MTKQKALEDLINVICNQINNQLDEKIGNMNMEEDEKILTYVSVVTNLYISTLKVFKKNQRNDCIELAKKLIESDFEISE